MNESDVETPIESEGLARLLIPGAAMAAIVGAGIFFRNSGRNEPKKAAGERSEMVSPTR